MPATAVLASVVAPTARVAHLGAVAVTVGLAGIPLLVTVARGGTALGAGLVLLALGTGAALAWAVDDPTEDLLAPMPVSAPVRSATRVLAAAAVAAVVCAATLGVVAGAGPGLPADLRYRLPEGAAAGAVALAAAFVAARRGERLVAAGAVMAGLVVPAVVAALAMRWPTWFPSFVGDDLHDRWWLLVVAGTAVVARYGRDPAVR